MDSRGDRPYAKTLIFFAEIEGANGPLSPSFLTKPTSIAVLGLTQSLWYHHGSLSP